MAKTREQILGFRNLTGVIQNPIGGVPDLIPSEFQRTTKRVIGKTATWFEVPGNRQTARLVQYGSPSVRLQQKGVSQRSAIFMHSLHHLFHDASVLVQISQLDNPQVQRLGQQTIATETTSFHRYFTNLRLSSIYSILRYGAIYFDGEGNLLPNSTGAVTTVDFSVPANNKDQLNGIIGASWATAGTDIVGDITAIQKAARKLTGYPLAHAFYGENILGYMLGNNAVKEFLKTRTDLANAFSARTIPDGFFGMQWHPVEQAFFADSSDTNQDWFGGDNVTFTPEPSVDWWDVMEGSYPVPTQLGGVGSDAASVAGNIAEAQGMFSYATIIDDPVAIKQIVGDTFLPTLKVPGAVYLADVTP